MKYRNSMIGVLFGFLFFISETQFSILSRESLDIIMMSLAEAGLFTAAVAVMVIYITLGSFSPWSLGLLYGFLIFLVLKISEKFLVDKYFRYIPVIIFLVLSLLTYLALYYFLSLEI